MMPPFNGAEIGSLYLSTDNGESYTPIGNGITECIIEETANAEQPIVPYWPDAGFSFTGKIYLTNATRRQAEAWERSLRQFGKQYKKYLNRRNRQERYLKRCIEETRRLIFKLNGGKNLPKEEWADFLKECFPETKSFQKRMKSLPKKRYSEN